MAADNPKFRRQRRRKKMRSRKTKTKQITRKKKTKWGISRYNIHEFKRHTAVQDYTLNQSISGFAGISQAYALEDVLNVIDLTALYESYKILYVEHTIYWSPTSGVYPTTTLPGDANCPVLYYRPDYDDKVAPTSLASMLEKGNTKSLRLAPNKKFKLKVRLGIQDLLQYVPDASAPITGLPVYQTLFSGRILDTRSPGDRVEHLGFKMGIQYPKDLMPGSHWGNVLIETVYVLRMYGTQ